MSFSCLDQWDGQKSDFQICNIFQGKLRRSIKTVSFNFCQHVIWAYIYIYTCIYIMYHNVYKSTREAAAAPSGIQSFLSMHYPFFSFKCLWSNEILLDLLTSTNLCLVLCWLITTRGPSVRWVAILVFEEMVMQSVRNGKTFLLIKGVVGTAFQDISSISMGFEMPYPQGQCTWRDVFFSCRWFLPRPELTRQLL